MFNSKPAAPKIESVIGTGTEIEGNIQTTEWVRVDGKIKGTIHAAAVVLGPTGVVLGDITANTVTIAGKIKGNVSASSTLELLQTGQVLGDIRTCKLVVADGASFEGNCHMIKADGQVIEMNPVQAISVDVDLPGAKKNIKVISDAARR